MKQARILDACCGSRMMWVDKNDPRVLGCDIRSFSDTLCDGRALVVKPDMVADFRNMPFVDGVMDCVLFDPPHLLNAGENSWLRKKYGVLDRKSWRKDLRRGFTECWRVLRSGGTLIFKWNSDQIPLREVTPLFPADAVFKTGKDKTYLYVFVKG